MHTGGLHVKAKAAVFGVKRTGRARHALGVTIAQGDIHIEAHATHGGAADQFNDARNAEVIDRVGGNGGGMHSRDAAGAQKSYFQHVLSFGYRPSPALKLANSPSSIATLWRGSG